MKAKVKQILSFMLKSLGLYGIVRSLIRKSRLNFIRAVKNRYGNIPRDIDIEAFTKKLEHIKSSYQEIICEYYYMRRIGEMSLTFHTMLAEKTSGKLYVMFPLTFSPDASDIANKALYNIISRQGWIEFIDERNYAFWLWAIRNKKVKCKFSENYSWNAIKDRSMNLSYVYPKFSHEEDMHCAEAMRKMNLHEPFVCINTRDNAFYKWQGFQMDESSSFNPRNSSIEDLYLTADKLTERNIQCVRMGSVVEKRSQSENIIDYAALYRTELMDLYLSSRCKFFMAGASGIMLMATLYGTPLAIFNVPVISFGGDMVTPLTPERDIIMMKKIWHKHEKRYLSLREILEMEARYRGYNLFTEYQNRGCEFINNTPEEIWALADEMNQRLDGTISYTQEEKALQERYLEIVSRTAAKNKILFYNGSYSTSFLKANTWFLE